MSAPRSVPEGGRTAGRPGRARLAAWLLALGAAAGAPAAAQTALPPELLDAEARSVAAAARMLSATVGLGSIDGPSVASGVASGVIVSPDGLILTVAHAIESFEGDVAVLLPDGRMTRARRLGYDAAVDAGMLRLVEPGPWPFVEPGDSTVLEVGAWCLAAGHSDGIVADRAAPVRLGRLRGVLRDGRFQRIGLVSDATLQPGDSGGPLVDLDGRLVGIGMSISTDRRDNFSVPIEVFKRRWDALVAGAVVPGESAEPTMDSDLREESLSHPSVRDRFAASVASARESVVELLDDDRRIALGVVVRDDGWILTKASALRDATRCRVGGRSLAFQIVATDEASDVAVLRVEADGLVPMAWSEVDPAVGRWLVTPGPTGRPMAVGTVSVATRPIPARQRSVGDDDEAPALGITLDEDPAVTGTILRRVSPSGPARAAGLRRGDRIVALDGLPTLTADALAERIRAAAVGDTVVITYRRDGLWRETEATLVTMAEAQSDRPRRADLAFSGPVSRRRQGFPHAFTHDSVIPPQACGGVVVGLDGRALGLTIARVDRTTSYAIPAAEVGRLIARLVPPRRS